MVELMTKQELKQASVQLIRAEIPKKEDEFKDRINNFANLFFVDDGSNAVLNMANAVKSSINSAFIYELSKHGHWEDLQEVRFWVDLKNECTGSHSIEQDTLLVFNYFLCQLLSTSDFYFTGVSCSEDNIRVRVKMSNRDKAEPYIVNDIYDASARYNCHEILNLSDVTIFNKVFGEIIKSIEGESV